MLKGLVKQKRKLGDAARKFATAELAVADQSPFLKYATPVPQQYNQLPALGYIPETKVTTLDSGLRVASETLPFAETATVGVWIGAGSRYETNENNGAAHFLEHMAFKGTKSRTSRQLEVEIENMGGSLNAYTSREMTCYFAKVFNKDVPKAVEILSDILQQSNLDTEAVEREKEVILREMEEVEGAPYEVLFDHLHATAFQYSPLGRTILGPAENIRKMTRDDLAKYIQTHYTAPRMVVAAAGGVNHDDLVKLSEQQFANLSTDSTTTEDLVAAEPAIFTGSEVRFREPESDVCNFVVAFKGASWTDPDAIPLMVMQTMLGGWTNDSLAGAHVGSELVQKISLNKLANNFMAFNTNYHDIGLFGIHAQADKHVEVDQLAWVIMREMSKMAYNADPDQIQRAINQLKAQYLFVQDGPSGIAEDIGRSLLAYGRRIPKEELFARLDAVDVDTVRAVADRFITDQEIAIAATGFTQYLPDYNWFRRRTYWLRY